MKIEYRVFDTPPNGLADMTPPYKQPSLWIIAYQPSIGNFNSKEIDIHCHLERRNESEI